MPADELHIPSRDRKGANVSDAVRNPSAAGVARIAPREAWWPAAVIPLLALAVYSSGIRNGFVHWDDVPYILANQHLSTLSGLWRIWSTFESPQYYPLTFTSYWLEHRLWGTWPTGYFVTNVLLHATNSLLVYLVLRALGVGRAAAWLTGALFAVHPLQVASVAWLAQRKNVLSGFFALLSILHYVHHARSGSARRYWASVGTFLCALLSKTATVTLPLSLFVLDWLVFSRRDRAVLRRLAPMLLCAGVLGLVTVARERAEAVGLAALGPQPLPAAAALWFYVGKIFWPATLPGLYPRWHASAAEIAWWLPAVALALAVLGVWRARQRLGVLPVWGLAHFVLMLAPSLGLVPFGYLLSAPVGDHFAYLALPGFFVALLGVGERLTVRSPPAVRRPAVALLGVLVVLALGAKSWHQVQLWRDGIRLWSYTLAHNPDSALAHNNLGVSLADAGRLEEALHCYREALERKPEFWMARINLGTVLGDLGRPEEAVAEFRQAVALRPDSAVMHFNLAAALVRAGQLPEAFREFAETVRLDSSMSAAYTNWGAALLDAGMPEEAISRLESGLALDPDDAPAHFNLGVAEARLGRSDRAIEHYRMALRIDPRNARTCTNLGLLLAERGQWTQARECLAGALDRDPHDTLAQLNLGVLAAQAGRSAEAERRFRAVLQIDPENVEAQSNLGILLVQLGQFEEGVARLTQALRQRPDHANAHYMLGRALAASDRPEEAIAEFRRALELQPDDSEARAALAAALASASRPASRAAESRP